MSSRRVSTQPAAALGLMIVFSALALPARATILTFEIDEFGPWDYIPQDYGDNVDSLVGGPDGQYHYEEGNGFTPDIVASYETINASDCWAGPPDSLGYWGTGCGDLPQAVFPYCEVSTGRIHLTATNGGQVYLNSFDIGAFVPDGDIYGLSVRVFCDGEAEADVCFDEPSAFVPSDGHRTFEPLVSGSTLIIEWGDQYDAHLSNVNFDQFMQPSLFVDTTPDDEEITNDLASYVPRGFDPSTGMNGEILLVAHVPPEQLQEGATASFELFDTSSYKGYAMNAGTSTAPDYVLSGPAAVSFDADGYAATKVTVSDWGGFTRARVTISPGDEELEIEVPMDTNDNFIADAGWTATDGESAVSVDDPADRACLDDDDEPAGVGINGDGLSAWEEYRGFIALGVHIRTSPELKDYFVLPHNVGFGHIAELPTADHGMGLYDLEAPSRAVNANRPPNCPCDAEVALTEQKGLLLRDFGFYGSLGIYGRTVPEFGPAEDMHPNRVSHSAIYSMAIRSATPPHWGHLHEVPDPVDPAAYDKTLSHEAGHAIGMDHYDYGLDPSHPDCTTSTEEMEPGPDCGPSSLMVRLFTWGRRTCDGPPFTNPCAGTPPFFTNMPTTYDETDDSQVRLK